VPWQFKAASARRERVRAMLVDEGTTIAAGLLNVAKRK
jgi:hypothetical protein